ncbi:TolB protein [Bacillus pakistanensis]|uniref:TolB protein n=1 Tax=Rossellomorea pakistanensis TaxID=992288 RepID=A0ABS2NGX0_9BACI|nr:peptidase M56 [Bacillus pakistanensis]MBM7587107.1 TolB protein [Bacillus pakistanensis]
MIIDPFNPSRDVFFPMKLYRNSVYNIILKYPYHWTKIPGYDERYGSYDGFFQISALSSGGASIDQLASQEAFHQLNPYGSRPFIFRSRMAGQEARFIFPSSDQPAEMFRQAALIVRYPRPITISGKTYDYFILWSDNFYIKFIGRSLRFLVW